MPFRLNNTRASKLTAQKVIEIREKREMGGYTQGQLAREYGVTVGTIRNILNGETWQFITQDTEEGPVHMMPGRQPMQPPTDAAIAQSLERFKSLLGDKMPEANTGYPLAEVPDDAKPQALERLLREANSLNNDLKEIKGDSDA